MVTEAKIRLLRDNRNWSQEYVAEAMGMSQPAYSKLESGQTKLTIERAAQLAKIFDVEPEHFFSTDATFVHYGKDHSYGPIQHNSNHASDDKYGALYEKILHEKDQRIEQYEQEVQFLKKELALVNGQISKLTDKL